MIGVTKDSQIDIFWVNCYSDGLSSTLELAKTLQINVSTLAKKMSFSMKYLKNSTFDGFLCPDHSFVQTNCVAHIVFRFVLLYYLELVSNSSSTRFQNFYESVIHRLVQVLQCAPWNRVPCSSYGFPEVILCLVGLPMFVHLF